MTAGPGEESRAGVVALAGAPNAGKSTLFNRLAGRQLALVTPRSRTTRHLMRGVFSEGKSQIILVDTPGLFRPRNDHERGMMAEARAGAADADLVLFLLDGRLPVTAGALAAMRQLGGGSGRLWPVLNKVDRVNKPALLAGAEKIAGVTGTVPVFMLSALTGDGTGGLRRALARAVPPGEWLCPGDNAPEIDEGYLAAEITRGKALLRLRDEVPHGLTVRTTRFRRGVSGRLEIHQTLLVMQARHRAIVIGAGGERLGQIGRAARMEIGRRLGREVDLYLTVEAENWQRSDHGAHAPTSSLAAGSRRDTRPGRRGQRPEPGGCPGRDSGQPGSAGKGPARDSGQTGTSPKPAGKGPARDSGQTGPTRNRPERSRPAIAARRDQPKTGRKGTGPGVVSRDQPETGRKGTGP